MKRFLLVILAVMLFMSMAVPVFASTPSLGMPSVPQISGIKFDIKFEFPDGFWDDFFDKNPLPEIEMPDPPKISTAKYVHKTTYYGTSKRLEIYWNKIEGADYYEVVVTKADGTTKEYTVTSNMIYDKNIECPKIYIEETCTWAAATVRVRAVSNGVYWQWSDEVKISCDKMH